MSPASFAVAAGSVPAPKILYANARAGQGGKESARGDTRTKGMEGEKEAIRLEA